MEARGFIHVSFTDDLSYIYLEYELTKFVISFLEKIDGFF